MSLFHQPQALLAQPPLRSSCGDPLRTEVLAGLSQLFGGRGTPGGTRLRHGRRLEIHVDVELYTYYIEYYNTVEYYNIIKYNTITYVHIYIYIYIHTYIYIYMYIYIWYPKCNVVTMTREKNLTPQNPTWLATSGGGSAGAGSGGSSPAFTDSMDWWKQHFTEKQLIQWSGLRENLQENPIFNGKIYGFL